MVIAAAGLDLCRACRPARPRQKLASANSEEGEEGNAFHGVSDCQRGNSNVPFGLLAFAGPRPPDGRRPREGKTRPRGGRAIPCVPLTGR